MKYSGLVFHYFPIRPSMRNRECKEILIKVQKCLQFSCLWTLFRVYREWPFNSITRRFISDRDTAPCSSSILGQLLVFHIKTLLQIGAILSCLPSRISAEARLVKLFPQFLPITILKNCIFPTCWRTEQSFGEFEQRKSPVCTCASHSAFFHLFVQIIVSGLCFEYVSVYHALYLTYDSHNTFGLLRVKHIRLT